MPIPDYENLMPRVLAIAVEEQSIREAVEQISDHLGLNDEERTIEVPSGSKTVIKTRLEGPSPTWFMQDYSKDRAVGISGSLSEDGRC